MSEYATWDEAVAVGNITDEADGYPDRLMVPLVEALRAFDFTTFQSCAGHTGYSDGHLWISEGPPGPWPNASLFLRIQEVHKGPYLGGYWEYWWEPDLVVRAVWELAQVYGVDDPGMRAS